MFSFQFVNYPVEFEIDESRIGHICELIAKQVPIPQKGILNIAFLPDDEVQQLNHEYRGIDKTTDVLSFHYFENFSDIGEDDIAGEIILSESKILAQAIEHNHHPTTECKILVIHSILHIIGFDHETDEDFEKMWEYEKTLREAVLSR